MKTVIEICDSGLNFSKHLGAKMHFTEKSSRMQEINKLSRKVQKLAVVSNFCFHHPQMLWVVDGHNLNLEVNVTPRDNLVSF